MLVNFTKMQSCGNDYIYIFADNLKFLNVKKIAKSLAIRRLSVGSDGLILIKKSKIADFKMQIYNADGSEAKMCGNAIRCVGKFVFDKKLTDKRKILIETLSGVKEVKIFTKEGLVKKAQVNIGKCMPIGRLFGDNINILGVDFKIFLLSVGNPHAVLFTEEPISNIDLQSVAKFVNENIYHGINVEIINKVSENILNMRVYERGSGETLACGTGASASVGALTMAKLLDFGEKVFVELKGGRLDVVCDRENNINLCGNVKTVFEGLIDLKGVTHENGT